MNVLTINTYAGSLLLGAQAFGARIVGSLEDGGFGQAIAQANFPDVEHVKELVDWPKRDLRDTIVLAHPPCSAFSVQNSSWNARGENAEAFKCTRRALDYATKHHALAIAVESVVGALGGAWNVHQSYARGYHLYRVLQNGCSFDTPQWRERFWVVYIRDGAAPPRMGWRLRPGWTRVREAVAGHEDGPSVANTDELLAKLKARLLHHGLTQRQMDLLFEPQEPPHPTAGIAKVMFARLKLDVGDVEPVTDIQRRYLGNCFGSGQLCYVDPDGLAPCLLGSSWWYLNGRNASESVFKRVMGFPKDYAFPDRQRRNMRTFLSKGVIPAVATWILGNVATHLGEAHRRGCSCRSCGGGPAWDVEIGPNELADFRFKRTRWLKEELPELRHFYEPAEYEEATR